MNYTIYTVSYNFVTHAICLLTFMKYKYNELQVSCATQKLNCKASCKTTFFFIVVVQSIIIKKNKTTLGFGLN
jgi:hypothetical protein